MATKTNSNEVTSKPSGNEFEQGAEITVKGVLTGTPRINFQENGGSIAGVRVRVMTPSKLEYYDISVFSAKDSADAKNFSDRLGNVEGFRVIVKGEPRTDLFNNKIQHKVTAREVWLETFDGNWEKILDLARRERKAERPLAPISLPSELQPLY